MKVRINSQVGRRIHHELDAAKRLLEAITPAVSVYGGARVKVDDPYYRAAQEFARAVSELGVSVISGGGPGIMEAANKGCQEGKEGTSIGLNIILPFEATHNAYQDVSISFDHFAARKVAFSKYAMTFVAFPGGFGTLDELFEVLTLIQTGKMPEIPVLLYGREFWDGMLEWMGRAMLPRGWVSAEDLTSRVRVVDSIPEALAIISELLPKAPVLQPEASEALA